MSNLFKLFRSLLPSDPLQVGTVIEVGTSVVVVAFPGGATITARGTGYSVGAQVFVRGGVVEGGAPSLPQVSAEV